MRRQSTPAVTSPRRNASLTPPRPKAQKKVDVLDHGKLSPRGEGERGGGSPADRGAVLHKGQRVALSVWSGGQGSQSEKVNYPVEPRGVLGRKGGTRPVVLPAIPALAIAGEGASREERSTLTPPRARAHVRGQRELGRRSCEGARWRGGGVSTAGRTRGRQIVQSLLHHVQSRSWTFRSTIRSNSDHAEKVRPAGAAHPTSAPTE